MLGIVGIKRLFIALLVLTVVYQFELILALFTSKWDENTLFFIIPFLSLILGCILLWSNNRIGIILLIVYSTYAGTVLLSAGVVELILFVASGTIGNTNATYMIFPTFNPLVQIFIGTIFLVLCLILIRPAVLEETEIKKDIIYRLMSVTIIIALMLTFN